MSTLTDLQRNKCNILPWEIITYEPSILQWNYPSLYCIKPEEEEKMYKGLIAHTNARTHTNTFGNDYFYPCHYFPPQMHLSEILRLHVQVRAVGLGWENVLDRNRTWLTLADLGLPSRNKPSRYGHTPSCVKDCYVLLRSPRSTTAHLSRSIPPWLPWQMFWLLMLGLHYVPGSHGSLGSQKRSSPWCF